MHEEFHRGAFRVHLLFSANPEHLFDARTKKELSQAAAAW
jgi:hypothetical protein